MPVYTCGNSLTIDVPLWVPQEEFSPFPTAVLAFIWQREKGLNESRFVVPLFVSTDDFALVTLVSSRQRLSNPQPRARRLYEVAN